MGTQDQAHQRVRSGASLRTAQRAVCLCLATLGLCVAAHAQSAATQTHGSEAVLSELSRRSEIPLDELRRRLAGCAGQPQGHAVCAQRSALSAEQALRRTTVETVRRLPACRPLIEASLRRWGSMRDRTCTWQAAKEWGGAAMEPTARNLCLADGTARMTRRIERMHACPGHG